MNHCYEPDHDMQEEYNQIICNLCKHKGHGITCAAFPDGIPMDILRANAHYISIEGDRGIVFEPK